MFVAISFFFICLSIEWFFFLYIFFVYIFPTSSRRVLWFIWQSGKGNRRTKMQQLLEKLDPHLGDRRPLSYPPKFLWNNIQLGNPSKLFYGVGDGRWLASIQIGSLYLSPPLQVLYKLVFSTSLILVTVVG